MDFKAKIVENLMMHSPVPQSMPKYRSLRMSLLLEAVIKKEGEVADQTFMMLLM
jgi:hypothetical protein